MAASKALQNPFEKGEETEDREVGEADESGGVVVPLHGEGDEDDEDDEGSAAAPERTETSRERRRNRYKEQKEGRERAERERDEARARVAAYEAQQVQAPRQGPQGPSLDEAYKTEVDKIYAERQALSADYEHLVSKGALTDGLKKSLWDKQRELNTREARVNARYAQLSDPANHPGAQAGNEERNTTAQWLRMNHSDVVAHPNAQAILLFAQAEEIRLVSNGAPKDFATSEKAIAAAKLHFGLTKRPAASPALRRSYSGGATSVGAGGAPNGGGATSMTLTKVHQELAEARFPELKPEDAHKKWANGIGRKVLAARAAKARA